MVYMKKNLNKMMNNRTETTFYLSYCFFLSFFCLFSFIFSKQIMWKKKKPVLYMCVCVCVSDMFFCYSGLYVRWFFFLYLFLFLLLYEKQCKRNKTNVHLGENENYRREKVIQKKKNHFKFLSKYNIFIFFFDWKIFVLSDDGNGEDIVWVEV